MWVSNSFFYQKTQNLKQTNHFLAITRALEQNAHGFEPPYQKKVELRESEVEQGKLIINPEENRETDFLQSIC